MTLEPGSKLGPYEVIAPLGAGGMGEVYKAKDSRLDRTVALKVLPEEFFEDRARGARFEREAKLLAALNHPNIAGVFAFEEISGRHLLAMELLEGATLRERLRAGPLPIRSALDVGVQMAKGLAAAHEKGIVHRDLKPENVFMTKDARVKILDFGLAKLVRGEGAEKLTSDGTRSVLTDAGVVMGTVGYMSPEQVRGEPADHRSDFFSFGTILYEMLSGQNPFRSATAPETMTAILKAEPQAFAEAAHVPPALERVVLRCLEKNPEERYQSTRDLAFHLEALASSSASASSAVREAIVPRRRAATAALVLAGIGIAFAWGKFSAPKPLRVVPRLRQLTSSGTNSDAAISPDGRIVAFQSWRDGKERIWLKRLKGGAETPLTFGPEDSAPRFSPDGGEILYRHLGSAPGIYRLPVVGGVPRRVLPGDVRAEWAPDGKSMAFVRNLPGRDGKRVREIGISGPDGEAARTLETLVDYVVRGPRWLPDSRRFAISRARNTSEFWEVVEYDVLKTSPPVVRVAIRAGRVSAPVFLDLKTLLVTSSKSYDGSGPNDVRMEALGSSRQEVLLSAGIMDIDMRPGGPAVGSSFSVRQILDEVELDASEAVPRRRSLTRGAGVDRMPVYSQDGETVLFSSDRNGDVGVWQVSRETGEIRSLTDEAGSDDAPALTRDGRILFWSSMRSGHSEIWTATRDGAEPRRVTNDGFGAENVTVSPDGSWIAYTSYHPEKRGIWKVRADGTEALRLVPGAAYIPEISPDGVWVAFERPDPARLDVVRLADGSPSGYSIAVPEGRNLPVVRCRWSPDSRQIYFIGAGPDYDSNGIYVQDFFPGRDTTRSRRKVAGFDKDGVIQSFGVSPDGKRLVISRRLETEDLVELTGLESPLAGARR